MPSANPQHGLRQPGRRLRACGLGRVSTGKQLKKGYSLPDQKEVILARIDAEDQELVAYEEDSVTGRKGERRGLRRIQDLAEARAFDVLWLTKVDRQARRAHLSGALDEWFASRGIRICYVEQSFEETYHGRLMKRIQADIAEWEGDDIASKTLKGRQKKAREKGLMPSHARFFGLRAVTVAEAAVLPEYRDMSGYLVAVSSEAAVAREMFERYDGGFTIRDCLRWVIAAGHPTATGRGRWTLSQVNRILRCRAYLGGTVYGPEQIPVRGEQIIPQELWDRVQSRLDRNREEKPGRPGRRVYPLNGCVFCGKCGQRMTGQTKTTKCTVKGGGGTPARTYAYTDYTCIRHRWQGNESCRVHTRAGPLEETVLNYLRRRLTPGSLGKLVAAAIAEERRKLTTPAQVEAARAVVAACDAEEEMLWKKAKLGFNEELVQRDIAALNARRSQSAAVVKRAEAEALRDEEEAVARAEAYAESVRARLATSGLPGAAPPALIGVAADLRRVLHVTIHPLKAAEIALELATFLE
jgi:DNA invertase Pin-like site-specific DNA recombinase